jgi:hypothetical protein
MACVEVRIADRSVLKLIRQWLRPPIREKPTERHQPPRTVYRREGTPQGGIITPRCWPTSTCTGWTNVSMEKTDRRGLLGLGSSVMRTTLWFWSATKDGVLVSG